jgi:hypothetical protein
MHQLGVMLHLRGAETEGEALLRARVDRGHVEAMHDLHRYYASCGMTQEAQAVWDAIPHGG